MTQRLENFSTIIATAIVLMILATTMSIFIAISEHKQNEPLRYKVEEWEDFLQVAKENCQDAPSVMITPDGEYIIVKLTLMKQ
jgi:hypothetical protein